MHLLVHIGSPKTGTTSIQRALTHSAADLLAKGVLYPSIPGEENHNLLSVPFRGSVQRSFWRKYGSDHAEVSKVARGFWDNIGEQVKIAKPDKVVLSGEHFFGIPEPAKFMDMLYAHVPGVTTARIVGYVRSPADFFVSELQQRLKASHQLLNARNQAAFYKTCLSRWLEVKGIELIVRQFSRDALEDQNIVTDLMLHGKVGAAAQHLTVQNTNETVSAEAMYLLHRFRQNEFPDEDNHFKPASDKLLRLLHLVENANGGFDSFSKPKLTSEYLTYFNSALPDSLFLRDRFGLTFPNVDYDKRVPWPKDPIKSVSDLIDVDKEKVEFLYTRLLHRLVS